MCLVHGFDEDWDLEGAEMAVSQRKNRSKTALIEEENIVNNIDNEGPSSDRSSKRRPAKTDIIKHTRDLTFSYRRHFRLSYIIRTSFENSLFFSFSLVSC